MAETYKLPPKLDLPAAAPLAAELRARLTDDLTLDAGEVTQIGALCTQVIASAALSFAAADHQLTIVNTTDRVIDQLRNLGFTPESLSEIRT
ncbi:STAS domain-containing protein [Pseudooceanicola onchidii]|uniref:STAS domain-containing protein n=1 Tax=Pseudooceanicola onchidii TaxID=2562279 RepID=UPI0010AA97CA|nr:STAS domain-containing protein [Pseudooceanicola onchidii]